MIRFHAISYLTETLCVLPFLFVSFLASSQPAQKILILRFSYLAAENVIVIFWVRADVAIAVISSTERKYEKQIN